MIEAERPADADALLSLSMEAEPGNVAIVREAVAEQAREIGLDGMGVADIKTAASEACANVVLHAYPDGRRERPLDVDLWREGGALLLRVGDEGVGIRPPHGPRAQGMRMGLLVVGALAAGFQIRSERDRGTELLLRFPLPR